MPATSRELVRQCLQFAYPERIPRDLWVLPWATTRYPDTLTMLQEQYPSDFATPPTVYRPSPRLRGALYTAGEYVDDWGCTFVNLQDGIHGEVRNPSIPDLADWKTVQPPYETLPEDRSAARDTVNRFCDASSSFVLSGCCPRPWERYQFLRGTTNSMIDTMRPEEGGFDLLQAIHAFYLEELAFWVTTDVDAICFMDDWGAQDRLLISPDRWRTLFKPLYRDYCDLAHAHGKFTFMHSDGYILPIYPDLIEVGVDAINSQLFCMDLAEVARTAKGKITFWGEMDRQHILPNPDPEVGREAVRQVAQHLYDPAGGLIAQFEFGPGANPETALAVFDEWNLVG